VVYITASVAFEKQDQSIFQISFDIFQLAFSFVVTIYLSK